MSSKETEILKELGVLKNLLALQLYYVHDVPAELLAKILDMNPNSIRNMFPKEKLKGRNRGKTK
ncbi:MAG: hypothetical protein KGI10_07020 [Thaumarchaeota archaeon]|nr:hypothetical protein [Nitrososphaerota archaeon]